MDTEIDIYKVLDLSNTDKKCIVDNELFYELSKYKWYIHDDGSVCRRKILVSGSGISFIQRIHREIMGLNKGEINVVDHINGNRLDNRKSNLRICTQSENMLNCKVKKNSKSGLKGVEKTCNSPNWTAYIRYNGKKRAVNGFKTKEDAYEFSCLLRDTLHGEFVNHG